MACSVVGGSGDAIRRYGSETLELGSRCFKGLPSVQCSPMPSSPMPSASQKGDQLVPCLNRRARGAYPAVDRKRCSAARRTLDAGRATLANCPPCCADDQLRPKKATKTKGREGESERAFSGLRGSGSRWRQIVAWACAYGITAVGVAWVGQAKAMFQNF